MAELKPDLLLRAVTQTRVVLREAGDVIRMGPERALSAGMVHRNAGERIERAMRMLDGVIAHLQGVAAPNQLAPEPAPIIGPVIPPGGETRRLYLLEHPEVAIAEERERQARAEEAERAEARAQARQGVPFDLENAPEWLRPAIVEAVAAFFQTEREALTSPEPPAVWTPPPGFGRTDLEDAIVEDDLVDQLTGGVGTTTEAVVRRDTPGIQSYIGGDFTPAPVGPDPTRPNWFPVGQIPPGEPIPPTPHTFRPFEEIGPDGVARPVVLSRDELDRLEAAAAERDGRRYVPLPRTAPGIVTDNPEEFERILAERGTIVPVGDAAAPAVNATEGDTIRHSAELVHDDGQAVLDEAAAAVPACPECGFQARKIVGLQGHATAKHGFKGNRAALEAWARGSSSSAA
jgi:hypothetical protein